MNKRIALFVLMASASGCHEDATLMLPKSDLMPRDGNVAVDSLVADVPLQDLALPANLRVGRVTAVYA